MGMARLTWLAIVLVSVFLQAQDSDKEEYVTGMLIVGKVGAASSCPPIVWRVRSDSPAAKAGIKRGDRLVAIEGHHMDVEQAWPLLHANDPRPVTLTLEGDGGEYTVTVGRVKESVLYEKEGLKLGPDGGIYPKDATATEMRRISQITAEPPASEKVFPIGHYPSNLDLFYPGFEIFVWKAPLTMTVGGIEDGPGAKAGVHYGDSILSVNGIDPRGKSMAELEQLFSSPKPAKMTLAIDRDGELKNFSFELEKASDVAAANYKQRYQNRMIPSVVTQAYLHCWDMSSNAH